MARAARVAEFDAPGRSGSTERFRLISLDPDVEQVFALEQRGADALGVEAWQELARFSSAEQASAVAKITSATLASMIAAMV